MSTKSARTLQTLREHLASTRDADTLVNYLSQAQAVARQLLLDVRLVMGERRYRILEIEFYLHSNAIPDPFVHSHDLQKRFGSWYLHRIGNGLRGGSFKGIDLTFGGEDSYGGILIRSLRSLDEERVVNGPSLVVDELMRQCGIERLSVLDEQISPLSAWEVGNLVRLESRDAPADSPVHCSPRVGLSLKRLKREERPLEFVMQPYRFMTEPRAIKKGRHYLQLELLHGGIPVDEVQRLTGSPRKKIDEVDQQLRAVATAADIDVDTFFGRTLSAFDLSQLFGFLRQSD